MVMDGVDTMSKAELVILCEKHKIDGGKTVATMRYALKKFFETNDAPDAKKLKVDPIALAAAVQPTPIAAASSSLAAPMLSLASFSSSSSGSMLLGASGVTQSSAAVLPLCPFGELCQNLHSLPHRKAMRHGGEYRDVPIKCRDGMGCSKLRDKEHLKRYAHDDDLDKVCKLGADCPELHILDHRLKFEHPGFRAQPVVCRDGAGCAIIRDRGHLYKYAHDIPSPATVPASSPIAAAQPPTTSPLSSSTGLVTSAAPQPAAPIVFSPVASVENSLSAAPIAAVGAAAAADAVVPVQTPTSPAADALWQGKSLDDFPLSAAPEATLIPIDKNSEEFWELEEKFAAHLQGRNEDYVEKRIKKGKKPIRFVLIGAEKVCNPTLEARFDICKRRIVEQRSATDSKECRERVSFHGTHPKNLKSILRTGLLRFGHPLNPCKTQVDDGYFGTNKKGVYVSRYADYTLKYSNRVCAVDPGDEVKTIMFRTMPGKSKHMEKLVGPVDPTAGFDSHSSPTFLEWYLFDEAQCCPHYVLHVRAVEDTRTAADDE